MWSSSLLSQLIGCCKISAHITPFLPLPTALSPGSTETSVPLGTGPLMGTHFPLCQTGDGSQSGVGCGLVSYKFHSSSFSYIYREISDIYMDTDINIDFQIPFQLHFHYRLLEDIKHSSLYYILGTCYFVYMSVYLLILISQFIPSFPLW